MTFEDLNSWPTPSLADPAIAVTALEEAITPADCLSGGLAVLLCARDGTTTRSIVVGEIPDDEALLLTVTRTVEIIGHIPDVAGVVLAVVRSWGPVNDLDRAVHQHALECCAEGGISLLGSYLVTGAGVVRLPVADAFSDTARRVVGLERDPDTAA